MLTIPSIRCVAQKRARSPGSPYQAVTLQASQSLRAKFTCMSRSDDVHIATKQCLWPIKCAHGQKVGPQVPWLTMPSSLWAAHICRLPPG